MNILDLIGNTPLVRIKKIANGINPAIFAKVEYLNPGGSIKDRIGIRMILDAEKAGLLKPGGTIIEPTSGNTGAGLAMAAAVRGYKSIFVMPDKMSKDKEAVLKAYGAEVVWTPTDVAPEDPRSHISVAKRLAQEIPNSFMPNQYFNENNPRVHYETTGPEIWQQTEGKITHFVAGIGTGGTMTGVARYLKERNPKIKTIGVDPEGSMFHHLFYDKKVSKEDVFTYKVEGIGDDFMPSTLDFSVVDELITVNDREAMLMTRRLAREEGLLVGGSSGSAMHAALKVAKDLDEKAIIVVILPDTGRNYLNKVYNDDWMRENGFI